MNKTYNVIAFILLIAAIICLIYTSNRENTTTKIAKEHPINSQNYQKQEKEIIKYYTPIETDNTNLEIPVNYPISLSWKTQKEIYKIRKKIC